MKGQMRTKINGLRGQLPPLDFLPDPEPLDPEALVERLNQLQAVLQTCLMPGQPAGFLLGPDHGPAVLQVFSHLAGAVETEGQ